MPALTRERMSLQAHAIYNVIPLTSYACVWQCICSAESEKKLCLPNLRRGKHRKLWVIISIIYVIMLNYLTLNMKI